MGMYTEIVFVFTIAKYEKTVIDILDYLVGNVKEKPSALPDHPFFKCDGWLQIAQGDGYCFEGETQSSFYCDNIFKEYHLTIRANLKNYDSEIEKFLDWIAPYGMNKFDFFRGYMRYEDCDDPTLIYIKDGKVILVYVDQTVV